MDARSDSISVRQCKFIAAHSIVRLGLRCRISIMLARLWLPSSSFWYLPERRKTGSDWMLSALPEQRRNRGDLGITSLNIYGSVAQWTLSSETWLELDCSCFSVL